MINCNPETVSTDYDTSDRLYFEPLTLEDVLGVCEVEKPEGVVVQFGGQTPLKLAAGLHEAGVPILGTSIDAIDLAEDRSRFGPLLDRLGYKAPPYATAALRRGGARARARGRLPAAGAPELRARRPRDGDRLQRRRPEGLPRPRRRDDGGPSRRSTSTASSRTRSRSTSTRSATATDVWIAGIMQHVEEAGIHSGRLGLRAAAAHARRRDARRRSASRPTGIAKALGVVGLLNVQFAIHGDDGPARDRGQPARLADGAVRLQGDRAAARQAGLPDHARRADRRPRPAARHHATATCASRRSCCRSTASPAPTRCSGRRCARPAR